MVRCAVNSHNTRLSQKNSIGSIMKTKREMYNFLYLYGRITINYGPGPWAKLIYLMLDPRIEII